MTFPARKLDRRHMKNQRGCYPCRFLSVVARWCWRLFHCSVHNDYFLLAASNSACGACRYFLPAKWESWASVVRRDGSLDGPWYWERKVMLDIFREKGKVMAPVARAGLLRNFSRPGNDVPWKKDL